MDLTSLTLAEAAAQLAACALSPVELTRACLARIEALDPLLNSFITVTAEAALAEAAAAEREIARGDYRGPLHGVPLALKDLFETAGTRTTAGSRLLADHVPDEDSEAVRRLRAAGAVLLGKLNLHELAFSVTNINPHVGNCHNPWDLDRIPGGSSGGSGAALAAELCLGALGSDTGGSIRIPAALCGVVGLKPTYGRVSTRGVLPLSWSLDHAGPMARRVADVALLLQALAGYDPRDPYSADVPVPDYGADLAAGVEGWRVALAWDGFCPPDKQLHPDVLPAVRAAAAVFEGLGARVEEVELPGIGETWPLNSRMLRSEALAHHRAAFERQPDQFGDDVRETLQNAQRYSAVDYALARRAQAQFRRQLERFFEQYDLLLTPTTGVPAQRIDEPEAARAYRPSLVSYTAPFNLTGLPALSVPCGLTREGLPLGLQLVGPAWGEARVLRAGYAYEQATPWRRLRPPLAEVG